MVLEYSIDDSPRRFHCVLASEQPPVALHGVAEQPFIGGFLSRLLFKQLQLSLLADKLLAR